MLASSVPPLIPVIAMSSTRVSTGVRKYLVIDGEYIWKYTHNAYDFSVLGNTPITYPIEWANSKIPGYAIRASIPNFHGLSAFVVMSSVAARFFGSAGLRHWCDTCRSGRRRGISYRPRREFNQTTHLQYQPWKGAVAQLNWRYDSGLVAGPVPCAGGELCEWPERRRPHTLWTFRA